MAAGEETTTTDERADLLDTLVKHRYLLRVTLAGLSDEQAAQRPTASELCLGGLIKHVAAVEARWADFIVRGAVAMTECEHDPERWREGFEMQPGEHVAGLLERYAQVAARTDALLRDLDDLDASQALPEAPWFEKGARWSARRVLLHVIAETAQHAGHADIIRETLDGTKTMG